MSQLNQQAKVIWLTGLSGAGKSTIAQVLAHRLRAENRPVCVLDGDQLRSGLNSDLGFSDADRRENNRRTAEIALLLQQSGINVIGALIAPFREDRDALRKRLPEGCFFEVFVDCPLHACEKRDVKGLYQKARKGEIPSFTGIDSPYEEPLHPALHLHTNTSTVEACVQQILDTIYE